MNAMKEMAVLQKIKAKGGGDASVVDVLLNIKEKGSVKEKKSLQTNKVAASIYDDEGND